MKAKVDWDLCTGCGLCADGCPEVFEIKDDVAHVIAEVVPAGAEERCREAAEFCPEEAISLEE